MKKIQIILIALLFMLPASLAFAQGCEDDGDDEGGDNSGIKIIGYLQTQYEYHLLDPDPESTFKFKRARLGVTGKIPYDFSYYVFMETSPFLSSTGGAYLLDAFISYNRYKWAKVSVGSFKQPFGQEVNTSCSGLHTIERSMVSDQIVAPQRDMGIMLLGGGKDDMINYKLALMNGRGIGVVDNNAAKDFIGRLTVSPIEYVRFGGSFRYGFPNTDDVDRITYAAELQVKFGELLIQSEYIMDSGDYNRAAGGGCGSDPMVLGEERSGFYAMAMYKTMFNLQPVVKFEMFNADNALANNELTTITFGANYWFNDKTRIQANYRYSAEAANEISNDAFVVQLQIKF